MTIRSISIMLMGLFVNCMAAPTDAALTREQTYSLFEKANQAFRQANAIADDPDQAKRLYEDAILNYEKIISDGQVRNPKLYYNLANAYLLNGDIGNAILNYRRAETLDKSDTNIQKNLAFARSRRVDTVAVKSEQRILQTLFFWHYDFSVKTKFLIACVCFAIVCIALTVMTWRGRAAPLVVTGVICGLLTICFLTSVVTESRARANRVSGVITAETVTARQGDGRNYPESFKDPLHAGTEFDLRERRSGWFHVRLSDNSDGWIPDNSAELI
ncbi:MAG: tetratricopeptide repeat protein [Planctomycetota bacterium]